MDSDIPDIMDEALTWLGHSGGHMEDARALARLRETVSLIGDERLVEGWAAYGAQSGVPVLGLILVTDERLIFIDIAGGMVAFPIRKVSAAEVTAPCKITFTAWFGRMSLSFDTPAALGSMLNLVRQDPAWGAEELNRVRTIQGARLIDGFESCNGDGHVVVDRVCAHAEPLEAA
jgi:hypothetical protein